MAGHSYSWSSITARNADEMAAHIGGWNQTYQQLSDRPFTGLSAKVSFPGLEIFREVSNLPISETGVSPTGTLTFAIPLVTRGVISFSECPIKPNAIMTIGSSGAWNFQTRGHADVVTICIKKEILHDNSMDFSIDEVAAEMIQTDGNVIQSAQEKVRDLRTFLSAMFDALVENSQILQLPHLRKKLTEDLLTALLSTIDCADDGITTATRREKHDLIEHVKKYLYENSDTPVTVYELCRELSISRRNLQYCFTEMLGVSPYQYLRALRLTGARRELQGSDQQTTSITQAATNWGFWHLSRFAQDYRRMFGELPSETLLHAR